MRFGRSFYQNCVPEWGAHYIDYYGLKKAIKLSIRRATEGHRDIDPTGTHAALQTDLLKVQSFYSHQLTSLQHRFDIEIQPDSLINTESLSTSGDDVHGKIASLATCLRYRLDLCKLMWYGKVNAEGLRCLARKLQGISPETQNETQPSLKTDFTTQLTALKALETVDLLINAYKVPPNRGTDLHQPGRPAIDFHPPAKTDAIRAALKRDDVEEVQKFLQTASQPTINYRTLFREALLQGSYHCVQMLSKLTGYGLQADPSGDQRNILHDVVLVASHKGVLERDVHNIQSYRAFTATLATKPIDYAAILLLILEATPGGQRAALIRKDYRGRSPLHYAAELGLKEICETLIRFAHEWRATLKSSQDANALEDNNGHTPLHLSVINRHESVTRLFLSSEDTMEASLGSTVSIGDTLGGLLHIALLQGSTDAVDALLKTGPVDLDYVSSSGETAVFIAVRAGSVEYLRMLANFPQPPDFNKRISPYGWTPLIIGCIHDRLDAVKLLLSLGVDESLQDDFGWTALDHVAFRGYWDLSRLLQQSLPKLKFRGPKFPLPKTNALPPLPPSTTRIFVNIGALNTRKPRSAVDLSPHLSHSPHNPHPTIGYFILTKGLGAEGRGGIQELPVLDDVTNYPYIFESTKPKEAKIIFQLFQQKPDIERPVHIGSAVAILEELGNALGPGRESLFRDHVLPIIGCDDFDLLGTITINFLLATPYPDPRSPLNSAFYKELWNRNGRTRLIGHRGLGMNNPAFKRLQIGENTIQSFRSTIDLGVSYVECDVQLTRDHVPIIYHDFLMSESGADIAPMNLSFDQFMCISDMQRPMNKHMKAADALPDNKGFAGCICQSPNPLRQRSSSFDTIEDYRTRDFLTRIKHTHQYKVKGFKGNVRGAQVHESFITLEELLRSLPEEVAFDVELKYPMLWEAEDWKMDLYGVEFNLYMDKTLAEIYQHGGNRAILLTSFSPELCILASHKQNTYPVMFLNESNLFPTGDVRASNLQEAIHFARHWGLPGIVMSSEPFVASPSLVRFVQDAGLMCTSFGMPNNDPEDAKMQAAAGIDAIIVDSVALINHKLKEHVGAAAESPV